MPWAAIIAAGAAVVSAVIGELQRAGKQAEARQLYQLALNAYGPDKAPELKDLVAQQLGETEFAKLREDPRLRDAQLAALSKLEREYETGGMTDADIAALRVAQQQVAARAGSDYESVRQMLARMGQDASGMRAASLYAAAGQGAADAMGNMAGQQQLAARQRALAALEAAAGLAGSMRGFEYGVLADRARAQDDINRFNARMRADIDRYNKELEQRRFLNRMRLADSRLGIYDRMAGNYQREGEEASRRGENMAQAFLSFGSAFAD
jgi:hypothetical protein